MPAQASRLDQQTGSRSRSATLGRTAATAAAVAIGLAAATYGAFAAAASARYGRARRPAGWPDPLLDRFMPTFEIQERHQIRIAAPPALVFRTACAMDLNRPFLTRAIFKTRGLVLRSAPDETPRQSALIPLVKSLGWGVLAEIPEREIVMGAATQPWLGNPVFRALPPERFAAFAEPDYVKIAWTLRAEPVDDGTLFLTETRATTTNATARRRFRRYWSFASPGIVLIRWLSLGPLKKDAEQDASRSFTVAQSAPDTTPAEPRRSS